MLDKKFNKKVGFSTIALTIISVMSLLLILIIVLAVLLVFAVGIKSFYISWLFVIGLIICVAETTFVLYAVGDSATSLLSKK